MPDNDASANRSSSSDDSDECRFCEVTFENGTHIVYERANPTAWVQAGPESTVDVQS